MKGVLIGLLVWHIASWIVCAGVLFYYISPVQFTIDVVECEIYDIRPQSECPPYLGDIVEKGR